MTLMTGLRSFLIADGAVAALVAGRIYPTVAPQGADAPLVVVRMVARVQPSTASGPICLVRQRVQLDSYAAEFDESVNVAKACSDRLHGHTPGGFMGSVKVGSVRPDGGFDDHEDTADVSGLFRRVREFVIWHQEE